METRLQHVLLIMRAIPCSLFLLMSSTVAVADSTDGVLQTIDIDTEFFELGVTTGIISVDDFSSELMLGVGAKFHATEDLFLQFTYGQADVSLSISEKKGDEHFSGSSRTYRYYDFLVGYNVMAGEVFPYENAAYLSSLYVVAGVGNTDFGGENTFTLVAGVGYKVSVNNGLVWSVDLKDHAFKSGLIRLDEIAHNIEFSTSIGFLF
ncbi:MAG: outer membrane beta-barrel domain-containing protein [Pseudomonadales bacterium]|nr:outer membrane beta-barrel domain-containing protein [Pseudomonadales bacterium]